MTPIPMNSGVEYKHEVTSGNYMGEKTQTDTQTGITSSQKGVLEPFSFSPSHLSKVES